MNLTSSKISTLMKNESPVFIVGAARSGTTILYRTLQRHSSFSPEKCQDETGVDLTESKILSRPYATSFGFNSNALSYMLGNEDYHHQFLETIKPIQNYQRLLIGKEIIHRLIYKEVLPKKIVKEILQKVISQETLQKTFPLIEKLRTSLWRGTKNDLVIRVFLYYAQQARGMKRILEKTPRHIFRLPELKETFPKAKLLFMYRHPIDVYSSYQRRLKASIDFNIPRSQIKWLKLSPQNFCRKYSSYMNIALQEQTVNPSQFMLIKYEDFTSKPQIILNNVLSFLGESYEENALPGNKVEKTFRQIDTNLYGGIKTKTKSWQDFTEESDAKFIEVRLSELMVKLDFPRYLNN